MTDADHPDEEERNPELQGNNQRDDSINFTHVCRGHGMSTRGAQNSRAR